jgi:DNA-directed RNA polymerase subunit E'/Rpb7
MDPLFERRELVRKVHIFSKYIQKNMQTSLLAQLKTNFEGRCSSEGFIQPQSITVLEYSLGRSNYVKGGVDYEVKFQADVCWPHPGQVFKATGNMKSKIGIHADLTPLRVLIPRDIHIGNEEYDKFEDGQDVEFEVADATFKQQDREIIVIGRLRTALKAAPLQPLLYAESRPDAPLVSVPQESDEKVVTVVSSEPTKKRKLKKPSVSIPNESLKTGTDEGTT